ncbi:Ubiquitin-like domain superfamily [Arabidopsis thaliana x Arabidopsis arenosa]|uniref:Membrane-anchored ubiquitin-fold protein n=1 Tax=Arabidopsis thaliana x Arabidopsis arenosa TaxID=1240361 RepID=A0A8T2BJ48_9BRAS|nr:Ubiquitin-like domain superfamily [Arabidopsis thaliana x Arabidopsis arenosa]
MGDEDWIELKFRLADGTDIGPSKYSQLMTVASLKEKIIAQWPKGKSFPMFLLKSFAICLKVKLKILLWADKENAPKLINEVKLINGGKILENNTTLSEARSLPICELPGIVTTMHVVLRPPLFDKKKEKLQNDPPMKSHCVCCIL